MSESDDTSSTSEIPQEPKPPTLDDFKALNVSETAKDFLRLALTRDFLERPDAKGLINHAWLCGELANGDDVRVFLEN